jgi:hypothetical protein
MFTLWKAFIKAVDELLKMKKETSNLKESIIGMNNDFQKSGKEVLYKVRNIKLLSKTKDYLLSLRGFINTK